MHLRKTILGIAVALPAFCQSVTLRNVSFPLTGIEAGNTVAIDIAGAAHFGSVTVVQNGAAPFFFGTTDGSGAWSISALETAADVGVYNQVWYVNGVPLAPANANATYFASAARLPDFNVYANWVGSNDPAISNAKAGCGGASGSLLRWGWSPVTFLPNSSVSASVISSSAGAWNGIQSKISYSSTVSARQDVIASDNNTLGTTVYGATDVYSEDCLSCLNYIDQCTGGCLTASTVFHAEIGINITEMNTARNLYSPALSLDNFAAPLIAHEFGHALRLGHTAFSNGTCSEVKSIMYPSASVIRGCGVFAPTSVDVGVINTMYPSAVASCPATQSNYCFVPSATCS